MLLGVGRRKSGRSGAKAREPGTSKTVCPIHPDFCGIVHPTQPVESLVADKKKLFLEDKFNQLSGDKRRLRKTIEKKRRKVAQKDKKAIPPQRLGTTPA
jgi:hypothetical protein